MQQNGHFQTDLSNNIPLSNVSVCVREQAGRGTLQINPSLRFKVFFNNVIKQYDN